MTKKTIPGFPDYAITKGGQVWSKPRKGSGCFEKGKWLKSGKTKNGYFIVCLCKNKKTYSKYVHRLVLKTYLKKRTGNVECCHNDGNKQNNDLSNLRWGTHSENIMDAVKHGTCSGLKAKGECHGKAKLTEDNVRIIIYMYRTGLFLQKEIADIYNISNQSVSGIITKTTWRHLWQKRKQGA